MLLKFQMNCPSSSLNHLLRVATSLDPDLAGDLLELGVELDDRLVSSLCPVYDDLEHVCCAEAEVARRIYFFECCFISGWAACNQAPGLLHRRSGWAASYQALLDMHPIANKLTEHSKAWLHTAEHSLRRLKEVLSEVIETKL